MSNSLVTTSNVKEIKSKFLELTSEGNIESRIIDLLNISRGQFLKICIEDPDFVKNLEEARKSRAEFWVSKIAESVDKDFDSKDIPSEKLKFEKLQFLAKADNPERYGGNKNKLDISLDLKQFKLLPPDEAVKALTNDPFAIEAEYTNVSIDKNNTEISIDEDLL
jgi:TusA-related sulfurtransferase